MQIDIKRINKAKKFVANKDNWREALQGVGVTEDGYLVAVDGHLMYTEKKISSSDHTPISFYIPAEVLTKLPKAGVLNCEIQDGSVIFEIEGEKSSFATVEGYPQYQNIMPKSFGEPIDLSRLDFKIKCDVLFFENDKIFFKAYDSNFRPFDYFESPLYCGFGFKYLEKIHKQDKQLVLRKCGDYSYIINDNFLLMAIKGVKK